MTIGERLPSVSVERAAEVGLGLADVVLSAAAAFGCYSGVCIAGKKAERIALSILQDPITFKPHPQDNKFVISLPLDRIVPADTLIEGIRACTNSGSTAAIVVGFTETLYQAIRYARSDHEKSWGTDMVEGGYRGAALGAATGFFFDHTGGEVLGQRIAAAIIGAIVGSILGNGLAGLGHAVRSIHVPKSYPPDERSP